MRTKKSILFVQDDRLLSRALRVWMEEYGHAVSCSNNGLDAIKLSKERVFDMILIDYNMPKWKGDMVCRLIRYHRPDGYIVGFSTESKDREFIIAGANKFIHKNEFTRNFYRLHQLMQMTP